MTPEQIKEGRAMRDAGMKWEDIAEHFGVSYYQARTDIIPGQREAERLRRARLRAAEKGAPSVGLASKPATKFRIAVERDADRLIAAIPDDTRTLTGRMLGDPLPQRSALWQKTHGQGA